MNINATKNKLIELVKWQVNFGPRYPGANGHKAFCNELLNKLKSLNINPIVQNFPVLLQGRQIHCSNIIAFLKSEKPQEKPLLLGTHFDTRLIGDNEKDEEKINIPIPGANDGGSGTAVLLYLLEKIKNRKYNRDIIIVFFDAEDVGNIDNNPFSVGARYYAENPVPVMPGEVLILDMIGGKKMILDIDAHIYKYNESLVFTKEIFNLAISLNLFPVTAPKPDKIKYIICDHTPFMLKNIPTCLLIDIDYPEWHTQQDLPEAMSGESLNIILKLIIEYLHKNKINKKILLT